MEHKTIAIGHCDNTNTLKADSLLRLLNDLCDNAYPQPSNARWIVCKWLVYLTKPIQLGDELTINCCNSPTRGLYSRRYFTFTVNGVENGYADSLWVGVIKGKPQRLSALQDIVFDNCTPPPFEPPHEIGYKPPDRTVLTVRRCDLDANGHCNNAAILALACEGVTHPNAELEGFEIVYQEAIMKGDVTLGWREKRRGNKLCNEFILKQGATGKTCAKGQTLWQINE